MTTEEAKNLRIGQTVYHIEMVGRDKRPTRAKVTSVKTWKRTPSRVLVGLKHGLYTFMTANEFQIDMWETDECRAIRRRNKMYSEQCVSTEAIL